MAIFAEAAHRLDRGGHAETRKMFGLPIGVSRTVELDRQLSDAEWDRLVVDLRETVDPRRGTACGCARPTAAPAPISRPGLVGSFGLLALIVAAIGIAAVLAFSVSARTNEIGIRMSLGADPGRVQWMVLREGGTLVLIGLALGVAGSLSLARLMQGLLFGVAPNDPLTLTAVAVLMATIGVAACWVPTARAARIAPSEALRSQ